MEVLNAEPPNSQATAVTSSPLSDPPSSDNVAQTSANGSGVRQYRSVKELPFELAQHVQTYYEEGLFTQAFDFLISVVSNSISPLNPSAPVLLPSPPHLALAVTMNVHPGLTTRTTDREKWNQANAAMRLLRLVFNTGGPLNANFCEALRFTKYDGRQSRMSGGGGYSDEEDESLNTAFTTRYATSDSIFTRVDDFWSVVGWAFNCSCLPDMYASRWHQYEPLLTFMLDLLEKDWEMHFAANTTEESLIWQFIELASGGYGRARRIIRAIFADGSSRPLSEFREVFLNELKPPKDEALKYKSRTVDVNIDKDEFGDYLAPNDSDISDEEDDSALARPSKRARTRTPSRRTTPRTSNESLRSTYEDDSKTTSTATNLGSPSTLCLRMRLLHLLSHVSSTPSLIATSPTTFPDLDELYTLFVEFIKPIPLPIFQQMLSPGTVADVFNVDAASTLAEMVLMRILEDKAPTERNDPYLTVSKMCRCYLPFAAGGKGSATEQAKVGLVCEALLRRCKAAGMLDNFPISEGEGENGEETVSKQKLVDTVEDGIDRREERAREYINRRKEGRKGKGSGKEKERDEDEALRWLKGSGERMRMVLRGLS